MSSPQTHEGPARASDATEARNENVQANDISNAEFLTALFGDYIGADADPRRTAWVCQFRDDPATVDARHWFGQPWDGKFFVDADKCQVNAFFSIGLLQANEGKVRKSKKHFAGLPCVMLDDIGTKADELVAEPTWLIETSPGNHQAGYLFTTPIVDPAEADAFIKALTAAGRLTDGGGQNITRYARLPVGWNTKSKYGEPFRHRLVSWEPIRRYDPAALAEALGLDLDPHRPIRGRKSRKADRGAKLKVAGEGGDEEVYTPRAEENPVITALRARGLYKTPLGSGRHDITCPWAHEHTDQVDRGTAYFEPDGAFPTGGFKCQHGHCQDRRLRNLLDHLGLTTAEAKHRPSLRVIGGALHTIVGHAETLLAESGHYFQQGGVIVQIVTDPRGETRVVPLTKNTLQLVLTRLASWLRFDKRSGEWFEIDAPPNYGAVLFDAAEYRSLPPLLALARQPFLRPDGTVCTTAGYDLATGLFGVFDPRRYRIPADPSRAEAQLALARLSALLTEFEFKAEEDRAAALCALLTAAVRAALPTAPGFLATAHTFGSGKSYLLELITLLATPDKPAAATFVTDDDEMKKQVLAMLMESPPAIVFDEMKGDLVPVKCLLSALTAERIEGRILGVSKMARPSTRCLMTFAGNNVNAQGDMTRRVLTIRLDPQTETPFSRQFRANPKILLQQQRPEFVAAALTVIRAWIVAGRPKANVRAMNGFNEWSETCREPLLWLGLPDPCENLFESMSEDPDRELLGRLLHTWKQCFDRSPVKVRDLIRRAGDVVELHEVLNDIAGYRGEVDSHRLGKWLKGRAGRIVDGMRLERDTTFQRNSMHWRLTLLPPRPANRDYRDYRDSDPAAASRDRRDNRDSAATEAKVSESKKTAEVLAEARI